MATPRPTWPRPSTVRSSSPTLCGVASTVCTQIGVRIDAGTLTGVDVDRINDADAKMHAAIGALDPRGGRSSQLAAALSAVRDCLDDATAAVTSAPVGVRVPDDLARSLDGRTAAQDP